MASIDNTRVHPLLQTARGLCSDEAPHERIDAILARAVEGAKDLEVEAAELFDEVDLLAECWYQANEREKALEAEVARLREALELIAVPRRADGTYNRDRYACELLAREALDGEA